MTSQYLLIGKTFDIKEELKAFGCIWDSEEKCWRTRMIDREGITYKRIKGLSEAFEFKMVPVELSDECEKIQKALSVNKKIFI